MTITKEQEAFAQGVVAILNGPDGPFAPLLANYSLIESQLKDLLKNMDIRDNRTRGNGRVVPFVIIPNAAGVNPPCVIKTIDDLKALTDQQTSDMCLFYGIQPMPGTVIDKQRAVADAIGIAHQFWPEQ